MLLGELFGSRPLARIYMPTRMPLLSPPPPPPTDPQPLISSILQLEQCQAQNESSSVG
jgi:hypothetical protein